MIVGMDRCSLSSLPDFKPISLKLLQSWHNVFMIATILLLIGRSKLQSIHCYDFP